MSDKPKHQSYEVDDKTSIKLTVKTLIAIIAGTVAAAGWCTNQSIQTSAHTDQLNELKASIVQIDKKLDYLLVRENAYGTKKMVASTAGSHPAITHPLPDENQPE